MRHHALVAIAIEKFQVVEHAHPLSQGSVHGAS